MLSIFHPEWWRIIRYCPQWWARRWFAIAIGKTKPFQFWDRRTPRRATCLQTHKHSNANKCLFLCSSFYFFSIPFANDHNSRKKHHFHLPMMQTCSVKVLLHFVQIYNWSWRNWRTRLNFQQKIFAIIYLSLKIHFPWTRFKRKKKDYSHNFVCSKFYSKLLQLYIFFS